MTTKLYIPDYDAVPAPGDKRPDGSLKPKRKYYERGPRMGDFLDVHLYFRDLELEPGWHIRHVRTRSLYTSPSGTQMTVFQWVFKERVLLDAEWVHPELPIDHSVPVVPGYLVGMQYRLARTKKVNFSFENRFVDHTFDHHRLRGAFLAGSATRRHKTRFQRFDMTPPSAAKR